jgi:hypothetical protein
MPAAARIRYQEATMDNFRELEAKLVLLINEYSAVKSRNAELEAMTAEKIKEIEEANEKIKGLVEDRERIRAKVDTLLGMLKEFDTVAVQAVATQEVFS